MESKMLSVIIPYYNGEIYIGKCLDSIYEQKCTFEIEVIIVNDGSSEPIDYLIDLCKGKYLPLNVRIISKKNGGQGSARNHGLECAKGKYAYFVDQDDMIPPNTFNYLIYEAEKRNVDLVICGYQRIDKFDTIKRKIVMKQAEWSKYRCVTPWAKLLRVDFLKRNNIHFLPIVMGEDVYFTMKLHVAEPRCYISEKIGYCWRINENSVSNTQHKQIGENTSIIKLFDKLEEIDSIEKLNKEDYLEFFYIKTAVWNVLYTCKNNDIEDVRKNNDIIWKWFEANYPNYLQNPYVSLFKLKGESIIVKCIVLIFMILKRLGAELILIKMFRRFVR